MGLWKHSLQKRQIMEDGNGERNDDCEEAAVAPEEEAIDEYGKECHVDGTTLQEGLDVCSCRRLEGERAWAPGKLRNGDADGEVVSGASCSCASEMVEPGLLLVELDLDSFARD